MTYETFEATEQIIVSAVQWIRLGVEIIGVLLVAWGVLLALWRYLPHLLSKEAYDFNPVRLSLARYLSLALEFQLGADILSTAIAPSWDEIGKLAAIAVIRTVLNYFLSREMEQEREMIEHKKALQEAVEENNEDG